MIRILPAVLLLAVFACSPAKADDRISHVLESAATMYVAGSKDSCPKLHLNMEGMIDMLKGYGLQVDDMEDGGRYHDEFQVDMATAALRYSRNPQLFCAAAKAVYANGTT